MSHYCETYGEHIECGCTPCCQPGIGLCGKEEAKLRAEIERLARLYAEEQQDCSQAERRLVSLASIVEKAPHQFPCKGQPKNGVSDHLVSPCICWKRNTPGKETGWLE
jgi:hypothetical protein